MADKLIALEHARALVLKQIAPLAAEPVALGRALGRVLAQPVKAAFDVPGFDNSAMDGYALRAADSGIGLRLHVVGESRAGAPAGREIAHGQACASSTGAAIPAGADAVIRVEDTHGDGDAVELAAAVASGANIRRAGEGVRAGALVLKPGVRLGPAELGVLAELGYATVSARRRPRVAIVTTGDELVAVGESLRYGMVHNSGAIVLPALIERAGAVTRSNDHVRDDPQSLRETLAHALEADVAVICGGISVGAHDAVQAALADLGVTTHFAGVALKPGRPTLFGTRGRTLVFGLPGNPVSSLVTFLLFARPALIALAGEQPHARRAHALLAEAVEQEPRRAQMLRCTLELRDNGWWARTSGPQGSHGLTSMLVAEAFALIPAGDGALEAGARAEIELL